MTENERALAIIDEVSLHDCFNDRAAVIALAIKAAVAEERERCAKVAEAFKRKMLIGKETDLIAAAIRKEGV